MKFNPSADLLIETGDVLIAMGERPKLKRLDQEIGRQS
jgi:K+/H+ antiporter YhaU regulatory subunit KhtT